MGNLRSKRPRRLRQDGTSRFTLRQVPSFLALAAMLGAGPVSANAVMAYVSNYSSGTVSVIDTATNTVVATIPVDSLPGGVAASADGTKVYVTSQNQNTLSVIDTTTNAVVRKVPTAFPNPVWLTVAAGTIYIGHQSAGRVSVLDEATLTVRDTFVTGSQPLWIAAGGSDQGVYVANFGSATVTRYAPSTRATQDFPVGNNPYGVAKIGPVAFVASADGTYVIDSTLAGPLPGGPIPVAGWGVAAVGRTSTTVPRLYVGNNNGYVTVVDLADRTILAQVPVGSTPLGMALTPAGDRLYVANVGSNTVPVIDTTANTVVATVPVGQLPAGVATTTVYPDTVTYHYSGGLTANIECWEGECPSPLPWAAGDPITFEVTLDRSNLPDNVTADTASWRNEPGFSPIVAANITVGMKGTGYGPAAHGLIKLGSSQAAAAFYRGDDHNTFRLIMLIDGGDDLPQEAEGGLAYLECTLPAGALPNAIPATAPANCLLDYQTGGVATGAATTWLYTWSNPVTDPSSDQPPTAEAGSNQSIHAGSLVSLDGSASFDDNTTSAALQYAWSFSYKPAGSTAVLTGANTATPTFVADKPDTYSLQLIVTDSAGQASDPDFVDVSASNLPPTGVVGADSALTAVGQVVHLDGSASTDPEHDTLTYAWVLTKPAGSGAALVANETTPVAYFTPDVEGTYSAVLTPSDPFGAGTPGSVSVTAVVPNEYVEQVVVEVAVAVTSLPPSSVTNGGNQSALNKYLQQAASASSDGNTALQINALERAIERTDGCALRGRPDPSGPTLDWVTTCADQAEVYPPLKAALDALTP